MRERLLRVWDHRTRGEEQKLLFEMGDERIDDLIRGLDDSDNDVRRAAQWMIRYLGNPKGMTAVRQWLDRHDREKVGSLIIGPAPLPLTDWEYRWIEEAYLGKPVNEWPRQDSFLYALALDQSPSSKELLKELKRRVEWSMRGTFTGRALEDALSYKPRALAVEKGLPGLVLENAFFIPPEDRRCCTRARVLGQSRAGDKVMIELYVNRGVLAEEWWHVGIRKTGEAWMFYWIELAMVS